MPLRAAKSSKHGSHEVPSIARPITKSRCPSLSSTGSRIMRRSTLSLPLRSLPVILPVFCKSLFLPSFLFCVCLSLYFSFFFFSFFFYFFFFLFFFFFFF